MICPVLTAIYKVNKSSPKFDHFIPSAVNWPLNGCVADTPSEIHTATEVQWTLVITTLFVTIDDAVKSNLPL